VLIVGAGFSGIAAAIELRRAGVSDLVIIERADAVGGAWRDNTYPGCACDVQSRLYELAAAPWPQWSRSFAPQQEIKAYLESVVEIFALGPSMKLNTELLRAHWDPATSTWQVATSAGDFSAEVLISACGGLTEPFTPQVEGMESFGGAAMHTARWDHSVALEGRRVAVVGTGASAIQVIPAVADVAAEVVVLQRTPPWVLPRRDRPISATYRSLLSTVPMAQRAARELSSWARELQLLSFTKQGRFRQVGERMSRRHLERQVPDTSLRTRLTPHYALGCKRILLSDNYYPALMRDNVTVAPALDRVTARGVVDSAGVEHAAEVIIWATGFKVLDPPLADRVVGVNGRTLAEEFSQTGMASYRGTTVAGFPNLFILQGPNTGLGHSSVVLMSEAQITYVVPAVASGLIYDVQPQTQRQYVEALDAQLANTVWQQGGCRSWYQNGQGRNVALWPGSTHGFARMMRRFDPSAYRISRRESEHARTRSV